MPVPARRTAFPLATGAVLACLLLAGAIPLVGGAGAQTGTSLSIVPNESVFEAGEPVRLTVWNNGSTPRQGVPTVRVHPCPTAGLCAAAAGEERVHEWTGSETHLDPGENLSVEWDRQTPEERPAPEGTYEAHLAWNGTAGTPDGSADSPRFELRNGTAVDPDAPRVDVARPTGDTLIAGPDLDYEVRVTGTSDLDLVRVSLDGRVVDERTGLPARETTVEGTAELAPGSHVLSVVARDDEDRVNRTQVRFALAPSPADDGVDYEPVPRGGLADVRADGEVIFETVSPRQADTPVSGTTRAGALVIGSTTETTLVHGLASDARLTAHTAGFAVEGPDGDRRAIVAVDTDRARAVDGELVVDLRPGDRLVVRPVTDDAADRTIAQAILDGRVAAEVHVDGPDGSVALAYGPATVETTLGDDRVQVDVTAPGPAGQAVVLRLGGDAPLGDELAVSLDGDEVPAADGLADALDPSEGTAESHVADEDGARIVAVSVDHFSTRSIVVETAEAVGSFLSTGAVLGAATVVTLAAWGLFRRPEA